ncbi:MAG: protein O-mannosyl-transferase family [Chloroflexota bacterium]
MILYIRTLAPGIVGHDAGEFQFVPYVFGIPHATGYPLFLLIGKAWSLLPLGSVAWRMNLLSAVFGALAVGLTCLCGWEVAGSLPAAITAGLLVGVAPLEWTWSTIAGVRSLAVAFVAAVLLCALVWERRVGAGDRAGARRAFLALALVSGLALDHHRTIALLLPLLALFILLADRRMLRDWRLAGAGLVLFVFPLSLYGVLPWRAAHGAPWDQYQTDTWPGFSRLVLAGSESAPHLNLSFGQTLARWPLLLAGLRSAFPALALLLTAVGLVWLARWRPRPLLPLGGYLVAIAFFTLKWNIGQALNLVYFMPAYVPLALLAAAGVQAVAVAAKRVARPSALPKLVSPGLAVALLALGVAANRQKLAPPREKLGPFRQDLFSGHRGLRLAGALATVPPRSTIVANWDQATVFWYAELVDHLNPTVAVSYPATTLEPTLRAAHGPVFLATATYHPAGLYLTSHGPLVRVRRTPPTRLPAALVPVKADCDGQIELAGIAPLAPPSYGILPITVYWKALERPAANYSVSVRLMAGASRVATQDDQAAPVLGLSPTGRWVPGEVVADYHELDLRGLKPGPYELAAVLYQVLPAGGFRNLICAGSPLVPIQPIRIAG